jgi:hypothetical protein
MTLFGEEAGSDQKGYIDLLWKGKIRYYRGNGIEI